MSQDRLAELENIPWLADIGQPDENAEIFGSFEDICEAIAQDPEDFFQWRDTGSYEAMCLTDHMLAAEMEEATSGPRIESIVKKAYAQLWARVPDRRLCELIADDIETILILLSGGQVLSEFTAARLEWYRKGRVPWGYAGTFPAGRWMVL